MKKILLTIIILIYINTSSVFAETYYRGMKKCSEYLNKDISGFITYSSDGKSYAYTRSVDGKLQLYKNRKIIEGVSDISYILGYINSGKNLLYIIKKNGKQILMNEEQKIGEFDSVDSHTFFYSQETDIYEIQVIRNGFEYILINGELSNIKQDNGREVIFSPNKKYSGTIIQEGKEYYFLYNGNKSKNYKSISTVAISNNGQKYSFMGLKDNKWFFVNEGIENMKYEGVTLFKYSPDGNDFIFTAKKGNKYIFVFNEKESELYDAIYDIIWYPNEKDFYMRVNKDGENIWNINGEDFNQYNQLYYKIFSPKGKEAYVGHRNDSDYLIVNGKETYNYDEIYHPTFSDDETSLITYVKHNGKYFIVENGIEGKHYSMMDYNQLSPNHKIYNFYAFEDGKVVCEDIGNIYNLNNSNSQKIQKFLLKFNKLSKSGKRKILVKIYDKLNQYNEGTVQYDILRALEEALK